MHQHGFQGVDSFETHLYWCVLEDFLERFTLILENKVLRCRNISVSHSLFQDELVDLASPNFPSLVDHPLWIVVVVEYLAEVLYFLG